MQVREVPGPMARKKRVESRKRHTFWTNPTPTRAPNLLETPCELARSGARVGVGLVQKVCRKSFRSGTSTFRSETYRWALALVSYVRYRTLRALATVTTRRLILWIFFSFSYLSYPSSLISPLLKPTNFAIRILHWYQRIINDVKFQYNNFLNVFILKYLEFFLEIKELLYRFLDATAIQGPTSFKVLHLSIFPVKTRLFQIVYTLDNSSLPYPGFHWKEWQCPTCAALRPRQSLIIGMPLRNNYNLLSDSIENNFLLFRCSHFRTQ